ncbi:MAG: ATPase [Rhodocyclales bacterium]|nr:ATPase [Rhodocyclales bacterium]
MNGIDDNAAVRPATDAGAELERLRAHVKQIESQLLQSEKLASVGQLAAGVAHEINNPVGFVSSNLGALGTYVGRLFELLAAYEAMEQALPAEHPARQAVARLRATLEIDYLRQDVPDLLRESVEGLDRVKQIISDLKGFSRTDEGQRETVDLHRGLESTLNVIWSELKYKAQVVRDYGELPPVVCIPGQINQVFMNLLVNAVQAIDSTGTITLRTGAADDRVWVEIADTGQGIPDEVRARIFEPFFTTKPVGKGTGLGLSISRDIVERHGGRLDVKSRVGEGTTFRIELPVDAPSAA